MFKVAVVSALYNKEAQLPYYLHALDNQWGIRDLYVCIVDDGSTDGSLDYLNSYRPQNLQLHVIAGESGRGQCHARNVGLQHCMAKGYDIAVVVDADIVLSKKCVRSHVLRHAIMSNSRNVVIGPYNVEWSASSSDYPSPWDQANALEAATRDERFAAMKLQSEKYHSYLNCVTRNLSVRLWPDMPLFDESYGYIACDKNSGFGWEDIEWGVRLHRADYRFLFDSFSVSVHVQHPPAIPTQEQGVRSLRNFARLVRTHPCVVKEDPQWYTYTRDAILKWATPQVGPDHPDVQFLRSVRYE